jgi:hypothetical protein
MRRLATILVCVTVLGGCGAGGAGRRASAAASGEVRTLVASFKQTLRTGRFPLACNYLSSATRRAMVASFRRTVPAATSCQQVMELISKSASKRQIQQAASAMTVKDVLIEGDRASIVISQAGKRGVKAAVRENGAWKLAE